MRVAIDKRAVASNDATLGEKKAAAARVAADTSNFPDKTFRAYADPGAGSVGSLGQGQRHRTAVLTDDEITLARTIGPSALKKMDISTFGALTGTQLIHTSAGHKVVLDRSILLIDEDIEVG